jgi:hypothetical protein
MKWLKWRLSLLALLCSGLLLQAACPLNENTFNTAFASAGSGFVVELTKGTLKKWFDYSVGL